MQKSPSQNKIHDNKQKTIWECLIQGFAYVVIHSVAVVALAAAVVVTKTRNAVEFAGKECIFNSMGTGGYGYGLS